MSRPDRSNVTQLALLVIAVLLVLNLIATLSRSDAPAILPLAAAQRQPPIAGGAGQFVMPAQLSSNTWGCYLMDIDRGTLCVYQFFPGTRQLQFVAARKYANDTKLDNFNTSPTPQEVAELVEKQNRQARGGAPPVADEPVRKDIDK